MLVPIVDSWIETGFGYPLKEAHEELIRKHVHKKNARQLMRSTCWMGHISMKEKRIRRNTSQSLIYLFLHLFYSAEQHLRSSVNDVYG